MPDPQPANKFPFSPPGASASRLAAEPIPAPAAPAESLVGRRLGPYEIERELARGGMGQVYYGIDPALRRPAAIKVMNKELAADADAMTRFEREARASASIQHPNIALIYMIGRADDGAPFLAMEYIDGGSIANVIRERRSLGYATVADWMIQCAEGLRAARKQGIIHRDIKPANVMVTAKGGIKLVDFGLAKFFNEDSYKTMEGMVLGTPRYMAPEQTQGRELDHRADIYSLGATFYHLLAGRPPFDADSAVKLMMKHVTAPLVPMRSIVPDVPIEFDEVIAKCMAKEESLRYQDYEDLISDLGRIKLQWMARDQGGMVRSSSDLPTVRLDAAGRPLAPAGSRSSAANAAILTESAPHEATPPWRIAAMAGIAVLLLGALVFGIMRSGSESPAEKTPAPTGKLARALQKLADSGDDKAGDPAPRVPANLLEYRRTVESLGALGRGLLNHREQQGGNAESLAALFAGDTPAVPDEIPKDDAGAPLDGWGRPFEYDTVNQTIASGGIDGTLGTEDDLTVDGEGNTAEAPTVYLAVEKEAEEFAKRR